MRFAIVPFALAAAATACSSDSATSPATTLSSVSAARAPGGSIKYKLRFVTSGNPLLDGEIQSDWFPAAGVTLNTRSPWKSLSVAGATIDLINSTHGSWTAGTCATFSTSATVNVTTWDIAGTSPVLSFAGRWFGTLSVSQTTGTSVGFDGDRVVGGVATPAAGGIHNVVTNANQAVETKDPSGNSDWFQIEIRNGALKFGAASSPNGVTNPPGAEVACANFTIQAKKATLTP